LYSTCVFKFVNTHKAHAACPVPCIMRIKIVQLRCVQVSATEFHPSQTIKVESACSSSFMSFILWWWD